MSMYKKEQKRIGGMCLLKALNVKIVTIFILVTCFICLIGVYKVSWSTQRLPEENQVILQPVTYDH